MIRSKADYLYYLEKDRVALGLPSKLSMKFLIKQFFFPDMTYQFEILLRKLEYLENQKNIDGNNNLFFLLRWLWVKYRYRNLALRLGFSISPNTFGPGLSIPHYGTIVVNPKVKVGANCRIHVGVNIGASGGAEKVPQIGDNVYIGPGAILFGDITIANNISIGANSTVTKSFLEPNVVIAGSPATIIKRKN